MCNVHLRELPAETLEILKGAAQSQGRSLNSEIVSLLNEAAERIRRTRDFQENVKPRRVRKAVDLEALLREDRAVREAALP